MTYANDTKAGAGSYTNDTEVSPRIMWSQAHRTWANSHFMWSSPGASFINDTEPSGVYVNDSKP